MTVYVSFSDDPQWVLARAQQFLASEPVLHNLILTLLTARVAHPEPGRYWVASVGDAVRGVAFQSPPTFAATITPMPADVVMSLVDEIAQADVSLPGVMGEAATAATFAGQWAERRKAAATPREGQRIYELIELTGGSHASGRLRKATSADRDLIVRWLRGFQSDTGEQGGSDVEALVDARLPEGQYQIWEDGEPVSMASSTPVIEGVSRTGAVYTPPERRRRGYAEACVRELSRQLQANGTRCMLYTQLSNPTSNSIYRRIGYVAIAEVLRYQFEEIAS